MAPFIKVDQKLHLHLARPELAGPIFDLVDAQRDYLRQWLPWVDATGTVEDTKVFIQESMEHNSKGTRLTTFLTQEKELIGSIGVVQFNRDHKKCEIGYWLRKDYQGKGLMTKACESLIDYLFSTKDLNRVEILVARGNEKSAGIPLRLGFKNEGTLRQGLYINGHFHDIHLFGLLRQEWETIRGKPSPIF